MLIRKSRVCILSEKFAIWITLRTFGFMRQGKLNYEDYNLKQGKAKIHSLELTSVFHPLPSVSPKQLCALAHLGCTCEVGTS